MREVAGSSAAIHSRTIIHSARIIGAIGTGSDGATSGGATTPNGWVVFTGDTITATGTGRGWTEYTAPFSTLVDPPVTISPPTIIDAAEHWLTPGFIDMHVHGGGGASFDDGADAIDTALHLHRTHGTTRSVLSLVTAPLAELEQRLELIADLMAHDPLILGVHLEGPFLDPHHKGAHDPTLLREADPDAIARLLEAGHGNIRQVTLAPELPGGMAAVRQFVDAGVAVAVGHTGASYEQTLEAFDAGASILTHAFNAMPGIHHRAPGPVAAATRSPGVTLEIINDGIHVHPEVVRIAFAATSDRIALITDAMAAAGSEDGAYLLGGLGVTVVDGVARLRDGGSIAGSTLTLDDALRRAVSEVGVSMETAVRALTQTPAQALGRAGDLGRLDVGYAADAVLLDDDLQVVAVWGAGRKLH